MKWENNMCEFHTVKICTKRRPIALKCASSVVYSVHTFLKYKLITKYYSQFCSLHSVWFTIDPKVRRHFCRLNQSNDSAISRWLYFIVFIFSIFFRTRQRIAATAIITTKCKTIRKLSIFMKELFFNDDNNNPHQARCVTGTFLYRFHFQIIWKTLRVLCSHSYL